MHDTCNKNKKIQINFTNILGAKVIGKITKTLKRFLNIHRWELLCLTTNLALATYLPWLEYPIPETCVCWERFCCQVFDHNLAKKRTWKFWSISFVNIFLIGSYDLGMGSAKNLGWFFALSNGRY